MLTEAAAWQQAYPNILHLAKNSNQTFQLWDKNINHYADKL